MRSFTNRAQGWHGDTTSVTVRLPKPVVEFMDGVDPEVLRNRSEFLQHWATVGVRVMESPELAEALEWAMGLNDDPVPPKHVRPYERPEIPMADGTIPPPEDPPERVPRIAPTSDEIAGVHQRQLEALRSKVF